MNLLLYSGGKDSTACLELYRNRLEDILVVWVNSGAPYPSLVRFMDRVRKTVPNFLEVKGNQPEWIRENGYPVDVLPVNNTRLNSNLYGATGVMLQSYMTCCGANLWGPIAKTIADLEPKQVICGLRKTESPDNLALRVQARDVEWVFPIKDWTDEEVFRYLGEKGVRLEEGYLSGEKKSRDCWNCTAWLWEDPARYDNLDDGQKKEVALRLAEIRSVLDKEVSPFVEANRRLGKWLTQHT